MNLVLWPTVKLVHPKPATLASFDGNRKKAHIEFPFDSQFGSIFKSQVSVKPASLKCFCIKNEVTDNPTKGFSVLASEIPWESGNLWSTMATYIFILHIPLGIGGLSISAYVLKQPVMDPQTQALSLLVVQILELTGTLLLLKATSKPQYNLKNFFKADKSPEKRNWLLASALGFLVLISLVFLTSLLADTFVGHKAVNPILKEILLSSNLSKVACVLVYCIITPLLEEGVYRGFLLTSLAATMNWLPAVLISSAIFSAAHFSGENFIQLFVTGCVLGCSYCWTGNLSSSILVHSLYNALTLTVTFLP
ncbi:Abi domain-containing protein [Cephalotus follicularis]|uniref:Abi domain-containing protein n=1 Tax=Cephalotus follicularis TaxID=3775 RepID=A0A1Q3BRR9_CEPFO|nr:Abi domain-containing protein [Cephalotus follicularis]